MLVAHLLGGNGIQGMNKGTVVIEGIEMKEKYEDYAQVCGSISLGDLDTRQSEQRMVSDYAESIDELEMYEDIGDSKQYIIENHLMKSVAYSEYKIDFESKTFVLNIGVYN